MGLFNNLKSEGLEASEDRLGGFTGFETDIVTGKVKMAYAGAAASGAQFVTIILAIGSKEYRETIYVTNRAGENWFKQKDSNNKIPLPGFTQINDMCLVTTGKELFEQDSEDKIVKVYDPEHKKEMPKSVPVLVDMLDKEVSVAIVQELVNKQTKQGDEYVPTEETQTRNFIEKVFDTESRMTVSEARNKAPEPAFWDAWLDRNKGKQRDKRTIKDGGSAGNAGRPGAAKPSSPPQAGGSGTAAPKRSLFGNK